MLVGRGMLRRFALLLSPGKPRNVLLYSNERSNESREDVAKPTFLRVRNRFAFPFASIGWLSLAGLVHFYSCSEFRIAPRCFRSSSRRRIERLRVRFPVTSSFCSSVCRLGVRIGLHERKMRLVHLVSHTSSHNGSSDITYARNRTFTPSPDTTFEKPKSWSLFRQKRLTCEYPRQSKRSCCRTVPETAQLPSTFYPIHQKADLKTRNAERVRQKFH